MNLLLGVLAFFLLSWTLVGVSLWLNPPLRDKPAPKPGKTITISGRPVEILPLEQFKATFASPPCTCREWFLNKGPCECPPAMLPNPLLVDIYTTVLLEGLLLRGICGGGPVCYPQSSGSKWRQAGGLAGSLGWKPGNLDVSLGGGFPAATRPVNAPVPGRRKEPVYA